MRYVLLTLLALSTTTGAVAQKKKKDKFHDVYGMVAINMQFYADQTEVTIDEWFGYVTAEMEENGLDAESAAKLVPDSLFRVLEPYRKLFMDHLQRRGNEESCDDCASYRTGFGEYELALTDETMKKRWDFYRYLPVTGVTIDQVNNYALWLQQKLMDNDFRKGGNIELRLPTPAEMESMLQHNTYYNSDTKDTFLLHQDSVNVKGCFLFNYHTTTTCISSEGQKESYGYLYGPVGAYSYFPSLTGLYGLNGNVAEMTSEKGVAMGGSWHQWARDCAPAKRYPYTHPAGWVGFRLVADVEAP
jgi:formylglycine-generating enzyme required for sulfatase activity